MNERIEELKRLLSDAFDEEYDALKGANNMEWAATLSEARLQALTLLSATPVTHGDVLMVVAWMSNLIAAEELKIGIALQGVFFRFLRKLSMAAIAVAFEA